MRWLWRLRSGLCARMLLIDSQTTVTTQQYHAEVQAQHAAPHAAMPCLPDPPLAAYTKRTDQTTASAGAGSYPFSVLFLHIEEGLQTQHTLAIQRHKLRAGHRRARRHDTPAVRLETVQQRLSLHGAATAQGAERCLMTLQLAPCTCNASHVMWVGMSAPRPISRMPRGPHTMSAHADEMYAALLRDIAAT